MDSKWVIGSPTYFTVFLKYKSWLKTFSACKSCFHDDPNASNTERSEDRKGVGTKEMCIAKAINHKNIMSS